jgi:hypothetical protein
MNTNEKKQTNPQIRATTTITKIECLLGKAKILTSEL